MKFTKLLLGLALLLSVAASPALRAQEMQPPQGAVISVERNEGTLIRLNQPITSVFVANPEVADVMVKSPRLIYLLGKRPGETTLYAVDDAENVVLDSTIQVTHNLTKLVSEMQRLVPDGDVEVQSIDGGLVLAGAVATAAESE